VEEHMSIHHLGFMKATKLSSVLLLLLLFVVSGCATSQKVSSGLLEESKTKTFKIGVIKTAIHGQTTPFNLGSTYIEKKKEALMRIPIEDICDTLGEYYSLKIDANVDKAPRILVERGDGSPASSPSSTFSITPYPTSENAYYGNLEYDNPGQAWLNFRGNTKIVNGDTFPDVINITYWMDLSSVPFKTRFLYAIYAKSSGKDVLELKGIVATVPRETGWFGVQKSKGWDEYVNHAGQVNEALKRDLAEMSKGK